MQKTRVRFLGREDPLEKEMANHSSILAWRIPWTEKPGGPQSLVSQESDTTSQLNHHHHQLQLMVAGLCGHRPPFHLYAAEWNPSPCRRNKPTRKQTYQRATQACLKWSKICKQMQNCFWRQVFCISVPNTLLSQPWRCPGLCLEEREETLVLKKGAGGSARAMIQKGGPRICLEGQGLGVLYVS